jgi:hypothetical protein
VKFRQSSDQFRVEGHDKLERCIAERSSHRSKILIEQTTFTSDINMRGGYALKSLIFEKPEAQNP